MNLVEQSALLRQVSDRRRVAGQRSPLLGKDWAYVDALVLDDFTAADWQMLDRQRVPYLAQERAKQALEMLAVQASAPTFGYQINNYEHCLQTATMAMRDGRDEETIVVSLFHDLGFITNNDTHGQFAAALLRPYISDRNHWMLERHMYFQAIHCRTHPNIDPNIRERWRGHPYFEYTAAWVARYDIRSMDSEYENAPLETFAPMVHRLFTNPSNEVRLPD
jgi:predicted HD phosphohydrolase